MEFTMTDFSHSFKIKIKIPKDQDDRYQHINHVRHSLLFLQMQMIGYVSPVRVVSYRINVLKYAQSGSLICLYQEPPAGMAAHHVTLPS